MPIRVVAVVAGVITIARMAYNVWLSPYELIADEAQYWDWSRHLDWAYYSKGPAIAWTIALTRRLAGDAEWAIRLPAALSFAVVMVALSWLTHSLLEATRPRASAWVPVLVLAVPAYQMSALLMTIDAPYLACWALALCAAWRAWAAERAGEPRILPWLLFGAAIGAGFLFKYTALFLVPGFLLFAWLDRTSVLQARWGKRAALAGAVLVIACAPVLIWNVQHEGAGVSHLLGYLRLAGGDRLQAPTRSPLMTAIEYPLAQMAVMGPVLALAILGARGLLRQSGPSQIRAVRFASCMSMPMLVFFAAVSFRARVEANWPMAAFVSLMPVAAYAAMERTHRWWWRGSLAYGIVALFAVHAPLAVAAAPLVGRFVPVHRFHGLRARVMPFARDVEAFRAQTSGRGIIVAPGHNEAALFAYYLPGRPIVASAGRLSGNRPSAYDFFEDTDLRRRHFSGRPALLVGGTRSISLVLPRVGD